MTQTIVLTPELLALLPKATTTRILNAVSKALPQLEAQQQADQQFMQSISSFNYDEAAACHQAQSMRYNYRSAL